MKKAGIHGKLNNEGSAIVTVLVVVAFLTILATVMLYISGANFQMKVVDYRTKESFYQAETPVEELKAQLVKDTELAFAEAYTKAMSEYSGMGDAAAREANYRQLFCEEMYKIWSAPERCNGNKPGTGYLDWETGIGKVVASASEGTWTVEVNPSGDFDRSLSGSNGQLIMRNVTFTYDSTDHFVSIISTDFCITIPQINWSNTFANEGTVDPKIDFSSCVNYMNWTKQ